MWSHELLLTGRRDINSYVTLSVTFASDHSQNLTIHDHCPLRWFVHPFPSWMGTGRNASLSSGFFTKIQKYQRTIVLYFHSHTVTHKLTLLHTLTHSSCFIFLLQEAAQYLIKSFQGFQWKTLAPAGMPALTQANHPKSHSLWGLKD